MRIKRHIDKWNRIEGPKVNPHIYDQLIFDKGIKTIRASLLAQMTKNMPAMWETWVRSLAWEDPLDKGKATHSSILA